MKHVLATAALLVLASAVVYAQQTESEATAKVNSTPAYSMLVERKVTVETELNKVLSEYTSDYSKAKLWQIELKALDFEMQELGEIAELKLPKLTEEYGTLILRRALLASERRALLLEYTADYPIVRLNEVELNLIEHEIIRAINT